jgi:phosphate uptake regulator
MNMWKELLSLLSSAGLCHEAYQEAMVMLAKSRTMFRDAVASFRKKEAMVADIYERDRELNRYERSVRRKIVTHLSVSRQPDVNMGLVLTAIVIDIERIGDYTKNIVELAMAEDEAFDGDELDADIRAMEETVTGMFDDVVPAMEKSDLDKARGIIQAHSRVAELCESAVASLVAGEALAGRSGQAVTAALYVRFLKRVSAHLKNIATSVVNPYHRIGFREKEGEEKG